MNLQISCRRDEEFEQQLLSAALATHQPKLTRASDSHFVPRPTVTTGCLSRRMRLLRNYGAEERDPV